MGDSAVKGLISGLIMKQKPALRILNLRANMLTDRLSQVIFDYINSYFFRLSDLDLSYNQLTDVTGVKVAKAI